MKFKIGDPVRIIARTCRDFDRVGTVTDIVPEATFSFHVTIPGEHPLWFGGHELILAELPTDGSPVGAPVTIGDVKWPLKLRDKVRILSDSARNGMYAGRVGSIASNELDGIVFVHLGMNYANFRTNDLERITETP